MNEGYQSRPTWHIMQRHHFNIYMYDVNVRTCMMPYSAKNLSRLKLYYNKNKNSFFVMKTGMPFILSSEAKIIISRVANS